MALKLATLTRNAKVAAAVGRIDGGPAAGVVNVYTGAQPATADTAASGTLLATFTLSDPAFPAPASGAATASGLPISATGLAAGTAGWFRVQDSTGASVFDGSVGATGSGAQLEINTTTVSVGLTVSLTGFTYTQPAT